MTGTGALSLKAWSKIHPPLPRTPRESQQLLKALTSSFRRQLDREYPPSVPSDRDGSSDRTSENPHSSVHATDRHLRAILDNPLFRVVPSKSTTARNGTASRLQQRIAKEPMVVFDELVASGSVTLPTLRDCLSSQMLLASRHIGSGLIQAMKDARAGSKVVSWWFASDSTTRQMLFKSRAATTTLVKFLVAEGRQGVVLDWLRMLANHDIGGRNGQLPEKIAQQVFGHMLVNLVTAEIQYGQGLSLAMRYYLQTCKSQMFKDNAALNLSWQPVLLPAGVHLCESLMQSLPSRSKEFDGAMYNEYIEILSRLAPNSCVLATAPLYHPTHPDAKPFLDFVDTLPPSRVDSSTGLKRESFMRAGFDALRLLVDQDKRRDVLYLARFLQQQLPEKVDSENASKSDHRAYTEREDLLSQLDLALA
ncbi:hypothetical protein BDV27DRAFT_143328 [Aspergillus caelatus]|uniref:Uncharacterized protein n=1 Tax=Aspergillus caelatus TaxID=61420 RepID=A0A5N7AB21_9EURO|nr:uncharacterized protein BDV27DRAFT_143328 [Aspergillus caelatus]KAE8366833.1 hypothetical protein BDV27DRAFT_143328 [Aspergillus caelatus]